MAIGSFQAALSLPSEQTGLKLITLVFAIVLARAKILPQIIKTESE
jgi:hypothetical protein